jgi:hypothetical protein
MKAAGKVNSVEDLWGNVVGFKRMNEFVVYPIIIDKKTGKQKVVNFLHGKYVNSGVIGFMHGNGKYKNRISSYYKKYPERVDSIYPLSSEINTLFKQLYPEMHLKMKKRVNTKNNKQWVFHDTVFTTATVNKNFQTAMHKDKGNWEWSAIAIHQNDIKGGYILFPEYRLKVKVEDGSVLFGPMNDLYHLNTEIKYKDKDSYRLSIVYYTTTKLTK